MGVAAMAENKSFFDSAFQKTGSFLRFRYAEPQLVEPGETRGSAMNPRVFAAEADEILGSREKRGIEDNGPLELSVTQAKAADAEKHQTPPPGADETAATSGPWSPTVDTGLVGLALSGGGIRSATFCLGVLQVLGERGVLRHVDYLSTVSGGGYIGSFWSCFLARSRIGTNEQLLADYSQEDRNLRPFRWNPLFLLQHLPGKEEGATFHRLRNYANYLLVGGRWGRIRGPALIIRGLIINFLMVLPYVLLPAALIAWAFGPQIHAGGHGWSAVPGLTGPIWHWVLGAALFVAIVLSTISQSIQRRGGRSTAASRELLYRFNIGLVVIALIVVWIDVQPLLLRTMFGPIEQESIDWRFLYKGEFWSGVSAFLGSLSAFAAGILGARESQLRFNIVLTAAAILVPLSLIWLYLLLTGWAVFGVPQWAGSTAALFAPEYYVIGAAVLLVISTWAFDVNATSLHNFYRDSLSRTFLFSLQQAGADRTIREEDDLRLGEIDIKKSGGPYHLWNAAVNNPDLEDDALRGRRSDFFVFGPRYCGNNRLGYCPTPVVERSDSSVNLGTALAVSAAAISPNMGEKTKPLLTFLLAMLNLRLGYWLPSPTAAVAQENVWLHPVGPVYFFLEMLGLGSGPERYRYVNLSDGGHIENLGIFELLRRRCRFIVAVDAEADPALTFNGLATVIRLARTDMGVDIEIDVDDLRKGADGFSRRQWAIGQIDYGDNEYGELLYIKASMTGQENEYIQEYRSQHPEFPHQSTVDQFFDEVQFEAYRALGYTVGASIVPAALARDETMSGMFEKLKQRSGDSVSAPATYFQMIDRRRAIDALLADPDLADYAREILPEAASADAKEPSAAEGDAPAPPSPEVAAKLYQVCNQQLQLMERAVIELRLDHPRHRGRGDVAGWINLFRRWANAPTFRRICASSIDDYSSSLRVFLREAFDIDA